VAVRFGVDEITAIGVPDGRGVNVSDGAGDGVALGVMVLVLLGIGVTVGWAASVPATAAATCVLTRAVWVRLGVDEITAIGVPLGLVSVGVSLGGGVSVGWAVNVSARYSAI
jgi:hypothetical protein